VEIASLSARNYEERKKEPVMRSMRAAFWRLFALFRKPQRDAEFAAELESHLQLHIEDSLRAAAREGISQKHVTRNPKAFDFQGIAPP